MAEREAFEFWGDDPLVVRDEFAKAPATLFPFSEVTFNGKLAFVLHCEPDGRAMKMDFKLNQLGELESIPVAEFIGAIRQAVDLYFAREGFLTDMRPSRESVRTVD